MVAMKIALDDLGQVMLARKKAKHMVRTGEVRLASFEMTVVSFCPPHTGHSMGYEPPARKFRAAMGICFLQWAQVARTVFNAV